MIWTYTKRAPRGAARRETSARFVDAHSAPRARDAWSSLAFVRERARMFFCSTCKRIVGISKRKPNRKTCSVCLKKSAARARSRRARQRVDTKDRGFKYTTDDLRFCSTCKCEKAIENLFGNNKSCERCLLRRRRARMHKASTGIEEPFRDETWPFVQIKPTESATESASATSSQSVVNANSLSIRSRPRNLCHNILNIDKAKNTTYLCASTLM